MTSNSARLLPLLAGLLLSFSAAAVTYTDNFSGKNSTLKWKALDYACLTAGDGTGTIPACSKTNDSDGSGALRLTPAQTYQTGAILSDFTFPNNQGLQVTFTTYTYGGDSGGSAKNGADGITFILTDGTESSPATTGGNGGSMGYSCSNGNSKYEGIAHGYLGLGIDEFGNFLNSGDNTNTGILNSNNRNGVSTYGSNSFQNNVNGSIAGGQGPQYQPERIGLRGAGNTTWAWLHSQNSSYYSGNTPNASKVQAACKSGQYVSSGNSASKNLRDIPYNYNVIPGGYRVLPDSSLIAKENTSTRDNAIPITYKLQISTTGLLNFSYSYNNGVFQPVLTNNQITDNNGPIPASFRFGFSAGTGGSHNVHEITCFQASPLQSNSSAGANTVQSGQVKAGTQIYLATYTTDNWWGSLISQTVGADDTGALAISSNANWDANCKLTGGSCPNLDPAATTAPVVTKTDPTNRVLLTSSTGAGAGSAFNWDSLTTSQKSALNSTDSQGQKRLNWLRGDRSQEQLGPNKGNLRARTAVLGDIIDSSPTWVGAPAAGTYPDAFNDSLYGTAVVPPENGGSAQAYSNFVSAHVARTNVVYVGGNDGWMHGFRAGSYNTDGSYNGTNNDGQEVLGFMPSGVLSGSAALDLTKPEYVHRYSVDATPGVGDLFYGNAWHTWLVGGMGTGGNEIFALDITDPSQFSEANAATIVKGDWSSATSGLSHLGNTVGTPLIQRMHNGKWAIAFASGLGTSQTAGVYIGFVDPTSGEVTFKFLDTGTNAGISAVTATDLDGDKIADYLYAGDLQGNVWRFDITDKDETKWSVSKLFVAKNSSGATQPISTAPAVAVVRTGTVRRVMVYVGTGQKTPFDVTNGDVYANGLQTFYGIWDWNMSDWNGKAAVKNQFESLTGSQNIARSTLLAQSVVSNLTGGSASAVLGYRTLQAGTRVCWKGSNDCSSPLTNNQFGWMFDLPEDPTPNKTGAHPREQIIYNPSIIGGAVVVSTAIPPTIQAQQCNAGTQSGYTMAFDPASGGGLAEGFFPGPNGSFDPQGDGSVVGGIRMDAVGSPTTVTYGGQIFIITQTVKGSASLSQVNPPSNQAPARVSWREIRH